MVAFEVVAVAVARREPAVVERIQPAIGISEPPVGIGVDPAESRVALSTVELLVLLFVRVPCGGLSGSGLVFSAHVASEVVLHRRPSPHRHRGRLSGSWSLSLPLWLCLSFPFVITVQVVQTAFGLTSAISAAACPRVCVSVSLSASASS